MLQIEMIAETVSANGYVEVPPGSIASVSAYQSGYVIDLNLLPGQSVKKGERLFSIESPELITIQQQYLETSEALKYLKSVLEREKTLDQEKISAKKTFEKAENEYKIMWSRHEALKKQLALIHLPLTLLDSGTISSSIPILASISGFISAVNIHLGDFINEAEVAIEIINTSHIHLELQVFERDASRIKKGQELIFSLAQTPDIWYPADVHLVSKTISGSERTVKVHADVADDLAGRLIPGMFVKSKIDIDAKEAMRLNRQRQFAVGVGVYTYDPRISPLPDKKNLLHHASRSIELECMGLLLNSLSITHSSGCASFEMGCPSM